ncbi:class I SAM-dependent methyltransferase [Phenylobacterium sp.]|uniref:class I SAM-dependent methyltransferase n=1 Tax=Phenylobacterium sp. TaxID=1871053 RepID=UPI002F4045CC
MRDLLNALRCPICHGPVLNVGGVYSCDVDGDFLSSQNQPVLVNFDSSILDRDEFIARASASPVRRRRHHQVLRRILKGANKAAARLADRMRAQLAPGARVLVVGGAVKGSGSDNLYAGDLEIVGLDIYPTALTQVVADAHEIPFVDETFDAVWLQAVLEHVLDPAVVVSEVHRVLKPRGLIFADTPFMQPVHEAAYDFTRFTRSGHRWLFRQFEEIEHGATAGAGTALLWSIRYFVRAVTGSRLAAALCSAPVFWLRFFDRDTQRHRDAASGFYFFGRKTGSALSPREMADYYDQAPQRPGQP